MTAVSVASLPPFPPPVSLVDCGPDEQAASEEERVSGRGEGAGVLQETSAVQRRVVGHVAHGSSREAGDTTSYVMVGSVTIRGPVRAVKGSHTNGVSSRGATNEALKHG